eukprot:1975887-Prymnesium_polylepis.1
MTDARGVADVALEAADTLSTGTVVGDQVEAGDEGAALAQQADQLAAEVAGAAGHEAASAAP